MKQNTSIGVVGIAVVISSLLAAQGGCGGGGGDGGSTGTSGACTIGSVRCACYGNGTCDEGLACLSDVCVSPTTEPGSDAGKGGGGGSSTGQSSSSASSGTGGGQPTNKNLIQNGDFSQGGEYWDLEVQAGSASKTSNGGEFCVQNESAASYASFSLGYPPTISDAFLLEAGVPYTLSYRVRGEAKSFEAKVGGAAPPYTTVASFNDMVSSPFSFDTKSHLVLSNADMPKAGMAFIVVLDYGGSICFDDVIFVKN